jgi:hypothetical protein
MGRMTYGWGRPLLGGLLVAALAVPLVVEQVRSASAGSISVRVEVEHLSARQVGESWLAWARESQVEQLRLRMADYNVGRELAEKIYDAALEADVDPTIAFGLVRAESSFRSTATSHVGAVGLTQLMPRTARWMEPGISTRDLRNPDINLRIGLSYLRYLLDRYDGDLHLALLAYNRGPGTVDGVLRRGGDPDNGFVEMVMRVP